MKKMMAALLAALMLPAIALAGEAVRIDGTIEAARKQTILAPHSGRVGDFAVRAGDELEAGDMLFTLSAQKVYADFDGTITGVFAQPGDSAASVQDRYGALCYMERETLYTADCTTAGAASENEYKIVHVGEKVYIRSDSNNNRTGEAIVTGVEGKKYTLEITAYDDIRIGEDINVYRDKRYYSSSRIGEGNVKRVDPVGITAEGYVRAVHVTDGQQVKRGDLLFEIVPDALEDMQGSDGSVKMPASGVLLSVAVESGAQAEKDQVMATFCERGDMKLICPADEEDLASIEVGMEVAVELDAYRGETIPGRVVSIAGAGAEDGSASSFDVAIELEQNDRVRIGMNATASF
ncbi:MAG: HlyD family efflux transporter periplasmic adaptor subunit [Clostridia bacterium]|nr:HlyD family efflux transporter periplasmic adaptor subunit [Clostridia bacterium]